MKRKLAILLSALMVMISLTACSVEDLPFIGNKGEGQPAGDDFDDWDDWDDSVEIIAEGLSFGVGDIISVAEIVQPDPSKPVETMAFLVNGGVETSIVCDEEGLFTVDVVVQYTDMSSWSGQFTYEVSGTSLSTQIPQEMFDAIAGASAKTSFAFGDYDISFIYYDGYEFDGSTNEMTIGPNYRAQQVVDPDQCFVKIWIMSDDLYANVIGETRDLFGSLLLMGDMVSTYVSNDGLDEDAMSELILSTTIRYMSEGENFNSVLREVFDDSFTTKTTETDRVIHSTTGEVYKVMKDEIVFFDYLVSNSPVKRTIAEVYYIDIDDNTRLAFDIFEPSEVFNCKIAGVDYTETDITNVDFSGYNIPVYPEDAYTSADSVRSILEELFKLDNSVFDLSVQLPLAHDDSLLDIVNHILVGKYSDLLGETGEIDEIPEDTADTGSDEVEAPNVDVVARQSYRQRYPGLYEWPAGEIIYRRWIYTIEEDSGYQGTIFYKDGTILSGTSGLDTFTGQYTPGAATGELETFTMRSLTSEYTITNADNIDYNILTGQSSASRVVFSYNGKQYYIRLTTMEVADQYRSECLYPTTQFDDGDWAIEELSKYTVNKGTVTPFQIIYNVDGVETRSGYMVTVVFGSDVFMIYGSELPDINVIQHVADTMIEPVESN